MNFRTLPRPAALLSALLLSLGAATGAGRDLALTPDVPVIRVPEVKREPVADGRLDEPEWAASPEYGDFGLDTGDGLLDFPTTVRLLRHGRRLWVGLTAVLPPDREGKEHGEDLDRENYELWLDNGFTGQSFHYIAFTAKGEAKSPGYERAELARALQIACRREGSRLTAELALDLDRFDRLAPPDRERVGFNLAREAAGDRWASLAGLVEMAHKPDQFWCLDLGAGLPEKPPQPLFRPLFPAGYAVATEAAALRDDWMVWQKGLDLWQRGAGTGRLKGSRDR